APDIPCRGSADRAGAGGRGEPRPAHRDRQGMAPARLRAVGRGPQLRLPRRRGLVAGAVPAGRDGEGRDVRQPAHRGQPPELPPRDRHPVRPGRRLGPVGGPLDGGGGAARRRAARLPRRHPRRGPGRARAGPDGLHDHRLRLRRQEPAGDRGLRVVPGAGDAGVPPQHRQGHGRPDRRQAARPHRHGREPPHDLLPEPGHRGVRHRARRDDDGRGQGGDGLRDARGQHGQLPQELHDHRQGRDLRPPAAPRRGGRAHPAHLEGLRAHRPRSRGGAGARAAGRVPDRAGRPGNQVRREPRADARPVGRQGRAARPGV
ncbi:MAG: Fatty acid desaturase occurring in virulence cluster, partial [uncultured Blastococcus sp.]